MASVYKRSYTAALPSGAEIVQRKGERLAVWTADGRRHRAPLTPDGTRIVLQRQGYTIQYFDHEGKRRKESVRCGDLDTAKQIAAEREKAAMLRRKGYVDPSQERLAKEARRPLAEHLADFERFLTDKGNTPKHVSETLRNLRRVIDLTGAKAAADLTGPAVMKAVGLLREGGASPRTCNSYLTSTKALTRWLWRYKRAADDPLCSLTRFNEETDRRHVRRELTPEEIGRLLATAEKRTEASHSLPGPDRAMCYRLALSTGFRAKELRSLTPESFDLSGNMPVVIVAAAYSKHRREDRQPIRADVADVLRTWLTGKPAGVRLFGRLPGGTARMLRADLAAARRAWLKEAPSDEARAVRTKMDFLCYENAAGEVVDFHSTRHTYISGIVAGGASVKTAQELARHSDPALTIGRYAHARRHDLQDALDGLPALGPVNPQVKAERGTVKATGTDGAAESVGAELVAVERRNVRNLGENWRKVGVALPGDGGTVTTDNGGAQVLTLARNRTRQQPLAVAGERAEGMGFEPTTPCGASDFESAGIA